MCKWLAKWCEGDKMIDNGRVSDGASSPNYCPFFGVSQFSRSKTQDPREAMEF